MKRAIWEVPGTLAEKFWRTGKADFPIYDMHGHMGEHYAIHFKLHSPAQVVEHIRRIGVKRLVFSHHHTLMGGLLRNEKVVDMCKEFPDTLRMYVGIVPKLTDNIREDLKNFDRFHPYAIGLKILGTYHAPTLGDPGFEYAYAFANERKLPMLLHTWGKDDSLLPLIQKYPDIQFFLGHSCFGAWDYAERCVKESAGNVHLELTALPGMRGLIENLVSRVGSEKLLFGTDMPWFDEYQAVGGVLAARISDEDRLNIFYKNVERLLGKEW